MPENAEPIRWFLTQGEGNSALFSATAVLAYRSFGIPARYAEGYLLPQSRTEAGELVPCPGRTPTPGWRSIWTAWAGCPWT